MAIPKEDSGNPPAQTGGSAGQNQSQTTPPVIPLDMVLGFVTEFNANTKIFTATTLTLLLAILQMKAIQTIADKHAQNLGVHSLAIAGIRSDIAGLKREIGSLAARSEVFIYAATPV